MLSLGAKLVLRAKVGVAGLGLMGSGIAATLESAGILSCVYNRSYAKTAKFRKAIRARNPLEMVGACDIIITCVTDYVAVRELFFGKEGIASGPKKSGLIVIDSSTISPAQSEECGALLKTAGIQMLSCPVMGGPAAAQSGQLVPIVSGDSGAFKKVKPVLDVIGSSVFYVGARPGAANAVKLALNLNIALIAIAVSEGINLVKGYGLDPKHFIDVLNSTYFKTGLSQTKGPKMVIGDFSPSFHLKNMLKDLDLTMATAQQFGVSIPTSAVADQLYRAANNSGYSELDYTSICGFLSKVNSLEGKQIGNKNNS